MKKKLFLRSLIGAPVGLAISTLITVIISLCLGTGDFYAAQPELIDDCGNEINAVLLQTLCSLILGGICGGSSIIWDDEKRSLLFHYLRFRISHGVFSALDAAHGRRHPRLFRNFYRRLRRHLAEFVFPHKGENQKIKQSTDQKTVKANIFRFPFIQTVRHK